MILAVNVAAIFAWITAHQALMLLAWPVLTAAASLVYTQLDKDTRTHAALSFLASIGVDLPKLWDALGRLLTGGNGGGGGSATAVKTPASPDIYTPQDEKHESVSSLFAFVADYFAGIAICVFVSASVVVGCLQKPIVVTPSTPGDVGGAIACVVADVIASKPVDDCIAQYGEALVADVLQSLTHSKNFADAAEDGTAAGGDAAKMNGVASLIRSLHALRADFHYALVDAVAGRSFGLGYLPDHWAMRLAQRDSRQHFLTASIIDASLGDFRWQQTPDQNNVGACTGHGTASAEWVSHNAIGKQLPFFPSPRLLYAVVRMLELPRAEAPLFDSGAVPSDLKAATGKWGIAPIGTGASFPTPDGYASDVCLANVNDKPSLLDL
jgi:hypothetical protein